MCKKLNKDKTHFDEGHENENNLTGGCEFLRRLKKQPVSYENYGFKQSIWDIEDLLVAFKKKRVGIFGNIYSLFFFLDEILIIINFKKSFAHILVHEIWCQ